MVKRTKVSHGRDKEIFRATASKSKKINVNPTIYRGGIRL